MRRFLAPVLTIVFGSFVSVPSLAASASADSASANIFVRGGELRFAAGDGQTDHVSIKATGAPGTWRVSDDAAGGMTPGAGCTTVDATDVDCSGSISSVSVGLRWGNDVFSYGDPTVGLPTRVFGGAGYDTISGEIGPDSLHGGWGSDWMAGFGGGDTYSGGTGNTDTVDYGPPASLLGKTAGVTVTTTDGLANDGFAGDHDNVGVDVEQVSGTPFDDFLSVSAGSVSGLDGNDTLRIGTVEERRTEAGAGTTYGRARASRHIWPPAPAATPCSAPTRFTIWTFAEPGRTPPPWTCTTLCRTARRCT